ACPTSAPRGCSPPSRSGPSSPTSGTSPTARRSSRRSLAPRSRRRSPAAGTDAGAEMSFLAAIQFDPHIRGVLVVLVGVVVLFGSVYLLVATNTGVRTGFLIAAA